MGFDLPLLNRRRRADGFSPAVLFSAGEQGTWLDPSSLTTLFTDAVGTTPVTAVAQTVALELDKSKGLSLGPELVTNGDGSSLTGWTTVGTATFTVDTGRFRGTITGAPSASGGLRQDVTVVAGKSYQFAIAVDVAAIGTGRAQVLCYDGAAFTPELLNLQRTATGSYLLTGIVRPTQSTLRVYFVVAGDSSTTTTAFFDNVSVRELSGIHAIQTTAGARPTLRVTAGGVYYLEDDGGDSLSWTAPAGTYTIAHVNSVGAVTIQTAQALSGATDALVAQYLAGYVAVNRALTAAETSALTAYLATKGGA